ncbi:hypothetical protein A2Z53_02605 [Candidatus Giovannonibacteria bacterium RIFCSPHIGHO2_02_42_15]|uniref:Uncharacterized protein n=2 Tax=Candidatus Giovannoniibacteriota TaxID=1752738 RepID=A0A1F5VMI0_9BACT|nr:MAG: hypothetical protein UV11_C0016G0018 [Candidatus Giovannonibacteria bacterium GW2011_GWF2_42_19]OGF64616.1 MAG: hypothetical protein A2Z53_02605 [Candidatus Giovannonibacteria bacterium RIFCSPHIGHO2_02_42_15]
MKKLFVIDRDLLDKPWLGIVTALVKAIPDDWTVFEGIIEAAPFVRDMRIMPRNVGFQISGDEATVATASERGMIGNGNPKLLAEFIKNPLPDFILFTVRPARYIPMKTVKDIATTYINNGYRGSITA